VVRNRVEFSCLSLLKLGLGPGFVLVLGLKLMYVFELGLVSKLISLRQYYQRKKCFRATINEVSFFIIHRVEEPLHYVCHFE
jgi:hypothetical protein